MEESAVSKYQEWLRIIANTRLIFNKLEELEDYLDNHSIKANGVLRSYNTEQKARAAFADLCMYVDKMTNGSVNLEQTMEQYEEASKFYQENLVRRKNHEKVMTDILTYFSYNTDKTHISKTMLSVLKRMDAQNIDFSIVILLVMDAWRTYKSKEGDAEGFVERYNAVIKLLADFTTANKYFEQMPAVTGALYERQKTRIKLLWYINWIIATYNQLDDIYDFAEQGKKQQLYLDISGYWNECGGTAGRTDFWKIEETSDSGSYFVTKYNKKQEGIIEMIRYSMNILDEGNGRLRAYLIHPRAAKHFIEGIKYDDGDDCHYVMPMPNDFYNVNELMMTRKFNNKKWCDKISLTRVTDKKLIKNYDNLLETCNVVNKYLEFDYFFDSHRVYAITRKALYIADTDDEKYYKVPFSFHESLSKMNLDSRIGILTMNNVKYLAFDELMKYIPVKKIKRYSIEVVERIE